MIILFTGDWQCSLSNIDRCGKHVAQLMGILRSRPSEEHVVVHLGDIKDALNPVDQRVTNFIIGAVEEISGAARMVFVRGNHDSTTTVDGSPSCVPVVAASSAGVAVADEGWTRTPLGVGVHLWCVPYFRSPARQRAEFTAAKRDASRREFQNAVRILALHNEVAGCERSAHSRGKGLSTADVGAEAYHLCVSGHIHRPQVVYGPPEASGSPGGHKSPSGAGKAILGPFPGQETGSRALIFYAGSPFPVDWGEVNEEKSILVARIERKKISVERVPSVLPGWHDPDAPGFKPQRSWSGARLRRRISILKDSASEQAAERRRLEKKYPGAEIVLVPTFARAAGPDAVDVRGGDRAMLRRYLEKVTPPDGATREQMEDRLAGLIPSGGAFGVQGIEFGRARASNVLGFEVAELDFSREGLTLVTGENRDWRGSSNGSGKSSVVSLPFVALFGQTFKGQKHDGWATRRSDAQAVIEQDMKLGDGSDLRISRTRRPGGLRAWHAGREVTMGAPDATQALIERLTNFTMSVATNAVYLGQREVGSVFGTEKERKELFSRLLGMERFIDANDRLRKEVVKRRRTVEEAEEEIRVADARRAEAEAGIPEVEEALRSSLAPTGRGLASLEVEIKKASEREESLRESQAADADWMDKNQKAFEKILFKATDLEVRLRHLEEQRKKLGGLAAECPTCGGRVDARRVEKAVSALTLQIEALENELSIQEGLQAANREERRRVAVAEQSRREELRRVEALRHGLLSEREKASAREDARSRLVAALARKRERVAELARIGRAHEAARAACLDEQRFSEACLSVVCRDGMPAYLCSVAAPELNAAAARYGESFSDGKIGVEFSMRGGDIDVEVRNESGGEHARDQSAGEMRMAGIIAALSFREVLVPHNVLILDEPGEGFDAENAAAFARGLQSVVERFRHVIVITHNAHILANLEPDREWRVVKDGGASRVEEIE